MDQQLQEFVIAQELVRATRALPGIANVYGGPLNTIATYGRGGRVPGVRIRNEAGRLHVEMHVIVTYVPDLHVPTFAETVRSRIRQQLEELAVKDIGTIDVVVDDVEVVAEPHNPRTP